MIAGRRLDRMPTVLAVEDLGGAETADDQSDENAVTNVLIEKVLPIAWDTEITIIANLLRG